MGLFRIYSSADTWITDGHPDLDASVRATGSNHGRSPSLNVFARKGDISSTSIELARTLIKFDLTELSGKIYDEQVVPSSSVQYVLRMFDMRHDTTVPASYDMFAYPLSRSWDEGLGIDDDKHRDDGYASWRDATSTAAWVVTGSDFLSSDYGSGTQHFDFGYEDFEADVTDVVINWLTGAIDNHGLLLKLGDVEESSSVNYYRKAFHGRESLYVDRIPYLEARWDGVVKDNRNNFAYDLENKLVMYNFLRGELTQVQEPVTVRVQDSLFSVSASFTGTYTAHQISAGILTASITIESTSSFSSSFYDIWFSGSKVYTTGTFSPATLTASQVDPYSEFTVNVNNLKRVFSVGEEVRLKVNVRERDYKTHVGSVTSGSRNMEKEYIEKMYFKVINDETGGVVIPFGTGSVPYTQLSYNSDGNYFDMNMNNFVPGFKYRLLFLIDINNDRKYVDDDFTFKVV